MNRNNGAQSSCVLLTMIISGCQHCWLWGFKIFPAPTQTSLPFPSFPSANRPQAALHYREACPSVFCERLSQIFTTWCVHAGVQHLPCNVLLTSKHTHKEGVWLHRGHLEAILVFPMEEDLCSAQRGQSIPDGLGISTASRKLLLMESRCPSQHRVPLGKSSPWPFVSSSLCFLLSEFLHLKEAQISTEISLQSGSLCHAPCLGGAICGVCGFKPTISQVSSANLSTELSSQLQQAHDFYLTCCQYSELSVALEGSFLSSRLFPRINRARWHTELVFNG